MATIEASPLGGKWSETGTWVSATIPGEADDVVLGELSGSVEVSAAAACRSIEASAYKKTLTVAAELTIGTTTSNSGMALKFGSSMTLSATATFRFASTSGAVETISFASKNPKKCLFRGIGGIWSLAEALQTSGTLQEIKVEKGELNTNGKVVITEIFAIGTEGKVKLGASAITIINGSWNNQGTLAAETSIIEMLSASEFAGGGATYNVVTFAGSNTMVGSNTIATLNLNTAGKAVKFTKSTVTTITSSITTNGKSGSLVQLGSTTAGKPWELKKTSGTVALNFLELKDSHAVGGAEWYAGANSTNVSGNEGWKFEEAGGKKTYEEAVRLGNAGKITAAGVRAVPSVVRLAAGDNLFVSGIKLTRATVTLASAGRLSSAGVKAVQSGVTLSSSARLTAASVKTVQAGSTLGSGGGLSSSGLKIVRSATRLAGGGGVTVAGKAVAAAHGSLAGGSQLSAFSGGHVYTGTVLLGSGGRLTAADQIVLLGSVRLAGGNRMTATGVKAVQASVVLACGGWVSGASVKVVQASVRLASGSRMTASPKVTALSSVVLRAVGRIRAFVEGIAPPSVEPLYAGTGAVRLATVAVAGAPRLETVAGVGEARLKVYAG
jgi:filamentous hemagglutinin